MKRTYFIAGIVATAVGLTAVGASAGSHGGKDKGPRGPKMSFEQLDTNGDGFITQDELDAHHKARFDEMDANGDGVISADELKAGMMKRAQERAERRSAKMMEHMDENGDGVLSMEEMQHKGKGMKKGKGPGSMIERFDSDGDGKISQAEFDAAREKMGKRHGKMKGGDQ